MSLKRLGISDMADTVLVCMSRLPGVPGSLADLLGSGIT
jgi:hypothetical protein